MASASRVFGPLDVYNEAQVLSKHVFINRTHEPMKPEYRQSPAFGASLIYANNGVGATPIINTLVQCTMVSPQEYHDMNVNKAPPSPEANPSVIRVSVADIFCEGGHGIHMSECERQTLLSSQTQYGWSKFLDRMILPSRNVVMASTAVPYHVVWGERCRVSIPFFTAEEVAARLARDKFRIEYISDAADARVQHSKRMIPLYGKTLVVEFGGKHLGHDLYLCSVLLERFARNRGFDDDIHCPPFRMEWESILHRSTQSEIGGCVLVEVPSVILRSLPLGIVDCPGGNNGNPTCIEWLDRCLSKKTSNAASVATFFPHGASFSEPSYAKNPNDDEDCAPMVYRRFYHYYSVNFQHEPADDDSEEHRFLFFFFFWRAAVDSYKLEKSSSVEEREKLLDRIAKNVWKSNLPLLFAGWFVDSFRFIGHRVLRRGSTLDEEEMQALHRMHVVSSSVTALNCDAVRTLVGVLCRNFACADEVAERVHRMALADDGTRFIFDLHKMKVSSRASTSDGDS